MLLANTPNLQGERARFPMLPWTPQEISLLIGLWPIASAAQISKWLNRSRASVCGKAMRLRRDDLLPAEVEKHFEVNPAVKMRLDHHAKATVTSIRPRKSPPRIDATVPPLEYGAARWSSSMTANAAGPSATCTRSQHYSAAATRCQDFPIASIICGWRDTIVVRNPIAPHRVNRGSSRVAEAPLPVG
jgi:hypothetical protein